MASLPPPRGFITSLITSLSNQPTITPSPQAEPQTSNPLRDAAPPIQKALLTLHILYPNELLPALDLLDRNLITRLTLPNDSTNNNENEAQRDSHPEPPHHFQPQTPNEATTDPNHSSFRPAQDRNLPSEEDARTRGHDAHHPSTPRGDTVVWRCRSSRGVEGARGRFGEGAGLKEYEVRLDAWSCSCPAFAFAAFPANLSVSDGSEEGMDERRFEQSPGSGEWCFGGLTLGGDVPVCKHLLACALVEYGGIFKGMAEERETSIEEAAGLAAGWAD